MSNIVSMKAEIKTLLEAIQIDSEDAFDAASVVTYRKQKFESYPAAVILTANVPSEYVSVTQNRRFYGFEINLVVPIESEGEESADGKVDKLMDAVMNAIDQSIDLNNAADFVQPVPSDVVEAEIGGGNVLMGIVRVVASKDVQRTL